MRGGDRMGSSSAAEPYSGADGRWQRGEPRREAAKGACPVGAQPPSPVSLLVLGALSLAGCNCPSYFRPFQGRFVDGVGAPVAGNVVTSTDDGGALHSAKTDKDGVFHVPAT